MGSEVLTHPFPNVGQSRPVTLKVCARVHWIKGIFDVGVRESFKADDVRYFCRLKEGWLGRRGSESQVLAACRGSQEVPSTLTLPTWRVIRGSVEVR